MSSNRRVEYRQLFSQAVAKLRQAGIDKASAEFEIETMLEADLHEVHSHGIRMLSSLILALEEGRVNHQPKFQLLKEFGAVCRVDCGNGPGRKAAWDSMGHAIERAELFGMGLCIANNTTHWGRAHRYATRAAEADCVGICSTNAIPTMAVWGASHKVIGNNPLAIGLPRGEGKNPLVLDMAMSQAAVGKVMTYLREGRGEIPANWGLDEGGHTSTDPSAVLKGAVLPMGEHKGQAMSLILELLTAGLSGGLLTGGLQGPGQAGVEVGSSKIFMAIGIEALIDLNLFYQQVEDLILYLDSQSCEFSFPGQRGWEAKAKNTILGVPLDEKTIEELNAIGVDI